MTLEEIASWLNKTYPGRDWNQQCQRLVWNVVWKLSGISEGSMVTYPTATAARLASSIVSNDPGAAPVGAIHYWRNPSEGHVGISLGGGKVLMTGTARALGEGGVLLGSNYGVTTVSAYTSRMGNPYLGWAHSNGANPNIIDKIGASSAPTRKDTRMHAVRQIGLPDSGVIIGGGQPPRARTNSVFVAECAGLGITPVDCPDWQYGTIIREAWADFNTTAEYLAKAVAGKVPSGGTSPIGLSDADAKRIAKAVADEHATRLKQ